MPQDSDIITQLQTCLDQLATQLYASLNYVSTRHPSQPTSAAAAIVLAGNNETAAKQVTSTAAPSYHSQSTAPASAWATQASAGDAPSTAPTSVHPSFSPAVGGPSQPSQPTADSAAAENPPAATSAAVSPGAPPQGRDDDNANAFQDLLLQEPQSPTHAPIAANAFADDVRELAADLVAKQKQIESLIRKLPDDLEAAGTQQQERLKVLEVKLRDAQHQTTGLAEKRETVLDRVEGVVGSFKRV